MASIAAIGLRLPHHHGPDLRRLADEDGVPELVHQCMKPRRVAGGFDSDRHGRPLGAIEPLHGVALMGELLLEHFARARVEDSNLLLSRVQITSNECHERGLLTVGLVTVPQPEPTRGQGPFS